MGAGGRAVVYDAAGHAAGARLQALRASIWAASGAEIVQNRILTYVSNVVAWSKCETPGLQGRCRGAAHAHGPGLGCGSGGAGGPSIYFRKCGSRSVYYVACALCKLPYHVPYYALAPNTDRGLFPQWSPSSP